MAILAHITYEFAVRVQRQCDGQGEPFGLNLFYIFDPLCLIIIIIIIIIIVNMIIKRLQPAPLTTQWGWWLEKLVGATESLTLLHDSHSQASLFVVSFCCCCCCWSSLFSSFSIPTPGKLVFPSSHTAGHFSMLGLGDVVMPGLLLCFVMRYDAYKRAQVIVMVIVCLSSCL